MNEDDQGRALLSMAYRGDPAPLDAERGLLRAWKLFEDSGAPANPGWAAAAHALGEAVNGMPQKPTDAMAVVAGIDIESSGIIVLTGGVGSGRSYACARLLWQACRRAAAGKSARAGRWIDAGTLGLHSNYRDKGDSRPTWPQVRDRWTSLHLAILDDLGAAGCTAVASERARELLEARHRAGKLTVVSTNLTDIADLQRELGGRCMDRSQIEPVRGESMRTGRLSARSRPPNKVRHARNRVMAVEALEHGLRRGDDVSREVEILTAWLLPGCPDPRAAMAHENAEADRQRRALAAIMAKASRDLAASRVEAYEKQAASMQALRDAHQAKAEKLLSDVDTAGVCK